MGTYLLLTGSHARLHGSRAGLHGRHAALHGSRAGLHGRHACSTGSSCCLHLIHFGHTIRLLHNNLTLFGGISLWQTQTLGPYRPRPCKPTSTHSLRSRTLRVTRPRIQTLRSPKALRQRTPKRQPRKRAHKTPPQPPASRDDEIIAQWAFHDFILGAKDQVIAQFGDDSNEKQALGLKKKSEYKSPDEEENYSVTQTT